MIEEEKTILKLLQKAERSFYDQDGLLTDMELTDLKEKDKKKFSKNHVGERSIVFRFGLHLEKLINANGKNKKEQFKVDAEYNRNLCDIKRLHMINYSKDTKLKRIIPDLIIHKRNSDESNLLIMEFKGYWLKDSNKSQWEKEKKKDIAKIEAFMRSKENKGYNYKYGAFIKIERKNFVIEWFSKDTEGNISHKPLQSKEAKIIFKDGRVN